MEPGNRMDLTSIRVVSWDVDGTLYSVQRMRWQLLFLLLKEMTPTRGLRSIREVMALRQFRMVMERARTSDKALPAAVEQNHRKSLLEMEHHWYGRAIQRIGPRPGVVDLLAFLASQGLTQVILSDYESNYKLASLGLQDRFQSVYAGESLGFIKPSPRGLQRIADDFKIPPAHLLHIGDRAETDGAAAQAAGCPFLILGRDFRDFHFLTRQFRSGH